MRILGRLSSINVQKVVWCAEDLGLAYERVDVGGPFGGNSSPEFLPKNHNGRIPVVDDGDTILWESNAIVRYLAAKYGAGTMWPEDPAKRAVADRWMDWASLTLTTAMHAAFWQLIRTPEDKRDAAAIAKSVEESRAAMVVLDGALSGKSFILGDQFSMGDIPVGCAVHRWLNLPIERPRLVHVEAWYGRLLERPGARKVLVSPIT
jgi:glutathione S-transferase